MSWLTKIGGLLATLFTGTGGGQSTVSRAIDYASEKIENVDEKNKLIVELIKMQAQKDMQPTLPWADALLKILDRAMWAGVVVWYLWNLQNGRHFDVSEVALMVAGPAAFSFVSRTRR